MIAGALALAGCNTDDMYQLPSRAMKELSPEMLTLLQQKNMPKDSPILVRIFKEESELEVWKQDSTARYELLKVYPICRWSGDIGPKKVEGDRQAPEGFYAITPGLMNPNSNYYLAINTGFPNAFDRANGYSGAFLMIHGDCSSRGCYAMTDEQIGEIYSLARESFLGGQKEFQVQAYPFRMTPTNLARHRNNPNMGFWKMIKVGDDHFLVSHMEPRVDVCEKRYVFDAQAPGNSGHPLSFSPSGHCPVYEINPDIAQAAAEKQRNDEYQLAQLISRDVPTVPLASNTDGGMNRVFASRLENPTYTYDNEGHLHVPPLQPGRLPPQLSSSSPSDTTGSLFSGWFSSKSASAQTPPSTSPAQVANADPAASSHGGFFSSLFGKRDSEPAVSPPQTQQASTPTKPKVVATHAEPASAAGLRPRLSTEARKSEPSGGDAGKAQGQTPSEGQAQPATPAPQQQANANVAAPPRNSGMLNGAQPVVPSGSFDNRWSGFGNTN